MRCGVLLCLFAAAPAGAESVPTPSRDDPRVQTVRFAADQPVSLQTAPGSDLMVILAPGERIDSVNVGNNAAFQVALSDSRDSFILHTSMVLYQGAPPGQGTIDIRSDQRSYRLQLSSVPAARSPYVLRFLYDRSAGNRAAPARAAPGYKLTGNKELRPASIRDDGAKTYIQWNADQAIPAVFALDRLGREEMVDGYMRDGMFTIDRVHERLVFRIDDIKAGAARTSGASRR